MAFLGYHTDMPTIAMTKRYRELNYRFLKLVQLYAVMSELRLHANKAVDPETSEYYHRKLYVWGEYASFLTASLESMTQVFYIELDGFIGAFWNLQQNRMQLRGYDQGSLAEYLDDGKRIARKRSARQAFETLLKDESSDLAMIHDLRGMLAHFKKLSERNAAFAPGDLKIRQILNKLAEILYLLGFQKWNQPHYIQQDDAASESVQNVVDELVGHDDKAKIMRKSYTEARSKWYGK